MKDMDEVQLKLYKINGNMCSLFHCTEHLTLDKLDAIAEIVSESRRVERQERINNEARVREWIGVGLTALAVVIALLAYRSSIAADRRSIRNESQLEIRSQQDSSGG